MLERSLPRPATLTARQRRFVDEYLVDVNATQAAIRAGYSARTASVSGCENLTKPNIAAAIITAMQARAQRTQITADRVLEELAVIAFSDIRDFALDGDGPLSLAPGAPAIGTRAVAAWQRQRVVRPDGATTTATKIRLWDKVAALRMLMQHLGLLVERHEHTESNGAPLVAAMHIYLPDNARDDGRAIALEDIRPAFDPRESCRAKIAACIARYAPPAHTAGIPLLEADHAR
jgi:phage terminase small subunit